jgi:hypothetical protein
MIAADKQAKEAYGKLSFFQRIKFFLRREIFIRTECVDSEAVAVFLAKCKKHGLYIDYGRNGRACPKCAQITKIQADALQKANVEIGDIYIFAKKSSAATPTVVMSKITDITERGFEYSINEGGGFIDFSSLWPANGILMRVRDGVLEIYCNEASFILSKLL